MAGSNPALSAIAPALIEGWGDGVQGGRDENLGSSARRSAVYHGNNHPRNPEEDFCILAQHARMACNPAVWGLSKRVRQPRSTRPHGPHFPKEETCIPAQHARMACNPALSIALPAARSLGEQRSTAYITSSAH